MGGRLRRGRAQSLDFRADWGFPPALGISLSRSSCLNYLRRLGFVLKRPKKRLVKADEAKREAFVADTPPGENIVVARPEGARNLCLDKGYDNPTSHGTVAAFQYSPHVRRIGEEKLDRRGEKTFPARR